MSDVIYRILPPEEFPKLTDYCLANGIPAPNPQWSIWAVAEVDGQIVGTYMLHSLPFADNLTITEPMRSKVSAKKLSETLQTAFPDGSFYVFAVNDRMAKMAEYAGYEQVPFKVYKKTGQTDSYSRS